MVYIQNNVTQEEGVIPEKQSFDGWNNIVNKQFPPFLNISNSLKKKGFIVKFYNKNPRRQELVNPVEDLKLVQQGIKKPEDCEFRYFFDVFFLETDWTYSITQKTIIYPLKQIVMESESEENLIYLRLTEVTPAWKKEHPTFKGNQMYVIRKAAMTDINSFKELKLDIAYIHKNNKSYSIICLSEEKKEIESNNEGYLLGE